MSEVDTEKRDGQFGLANFLVAVMALILGYLAFVGAHDAVSAIPFMIGLLTAATVLGNLR